MSPARCSTPGVLLPVTLTLLLLLPGCQSVITAFKGPDSRPDTAASGAGVTGLKPQSPEVGSDIIVMDEPATSSPLPRPPEGAGPGSGRVGARSTPQAAFLEDAPATSAHGAEGEPADGTGNASATATPELAGDVPDIASRAPASGSLVRYAPDIPADKPVNPRPMVPVSLSGHAAPLPRSPLPLETGNGLAPVEPVAPAPAGSAIQQEELPAGSAPGAEVAPSRAGNVANVDTGTPRSGPPGAEVIGAGPAGSPPSARPALEGWNVRAALAGGALLADPSGSLHTVFPGSLLDGPGQIGPIYWNPRCHAGRGGLAGCWIVTTAAGPLASPPTSSP